MPHAAAEDARGMPEIGAMSGLAATRERDCAGTLAPTAAFADILAFAQAVGERQALPVAAANGRILARDVATTFPLPRFDNSAVDGYGITVADVDRPPPLRLTVTGQVAAGAAIASVARAGEAVRILTGAAIPAGVAAVIMEERCRRDGDTLTVDQTVAHGMNIRRQGEDVGQGAAIVESGTLLDARHIAILAAAGVGAVDVVRPIRVGILSNGNELRDDNAALAAAQIHDANRPMLKALLARPWIEVVDLGCHRDDPQVLSRVFAAGAAQTDVIVSSGGVTGSDADHVGPAIAAAGGVVRRFRLALKPGKPVLAGRIGRTALLGLPGNPVAALVDFLLFGHALLAATAGLPAAYPVGGRAVAAAPFARAPGRTEFVPVRIVGRHPTGCPIVDWLGRGGSARLRPLALADGLAEIAADVAAVTPDAAVAFHPFPAAFAP